MSKISFEKFLAEFAKDLEIKNNDFKDKPLSDIPQYDSMGKITISVTIDKMFQFEIPVDVLNKVENLSSLYDYCIKNSKINN